MRHFLEFFDAGGLDDHLDFRLKVGTSVNISALVNVHRKFMFFTFLITELNARASTGQTYKQTDGHWPSRATAGPGKTFSRGPGKHSRGAPQGRNFFNFFLKWRILVYFVFLSDGGAPNFAGPG